MLGILCILAVSWVLLYAVDRKNLSVLGFTPFPKRLKQVALGFLVSSALCLLAAWLVDSLKGAEWHFNPAVTVSQVCRSLWWDLKSVLTEELLFRGAFLYLAVKLLGTRWAIFLSAVAFGVYHWFSYGLWGDYLPMVVVFAGTGLMGYAWALGYVKTGSILLPVGLHLGWNVAQNTVLSGGPLGSVIVITTGGVEPQGGFSLTLYLLSNLLVPILMLLYVLYFVPDERKLQDTNPCSP